MAKGNYYAKNTVELRRQLKAAVPQETLRELHNRSPAKHFLVAGRHIAFTALMVVCLWQSTWPILWVPAALLMGACLLGFTVLVHEVVHQSIFNKRRPQLEYWIGRLYALPVNMNPSQFTPWHLDHHAELGHEQDDPKRANLSPKRNNRFAKLLYASPWLFVIYGAAALKEGRTYPEEQRKKIRFERITGTLFHVALLATMATFAGWPITLRVYLIPLFFCFPIAFTINRIGQHYNIDPERPAHWSSLVAGNPFLHFIFLWSNFHLEHHYFPRVPFYNLRRLHQVLQPFYKEQGIQSRGYLELLWGYFVKNRRAHTNWSKTDGDSASGETAQQAAL